MDLVSRQSAAAGVVPLRVSYNAFLGTIWAGAGISCLTVACRFYSRFRGPGRLFWDDVPVVFALILILITGALWQWGAKDMYYVINVQSGIDAMEADFFDRLKRWLLVSLIVELFFYTSLFAIKLSFLLFFRRLGAVVRNFKYVWWPVLFVTVATYLGSVGDVNYNCLVGPVDYVITACNAPATIEWTDMTLKVNCALDVLSDFLIMLLPTLLLWQVKIRWEKKLAIFGLFSLTLVTMIIAIVRTASIGLTKRPDGNDDVSYLWLWSAIEPPVALIVVCLSAFPQLFKQSPRTKKPTFSPSETQLRLISRIRASRSKQQQKDSWGSLDTDSQLEARDYGRLGSSEAQPQMSENVKPAVTPNAPWVGHTHTGRPEDNHGKEQIRQHYEVSVTRD